VPDGAECVRRLVRDGTGFDGMFCFTDTVAMGALRGLADEGVPVPGRVRVIGFDNVEQPRITRAGRAVSEAGCATAVYSDEVRPVETGSVLCVRTGDGRHAAAFVVEAPTAASRTATLDVIVWDR
jgi:hypothetical protein